ncbi:hypothetical protein D3C80_2110350 [compost metagenome]
MFSKVDEAISWPARVISATVMVDTNDESLSIITRVLPYGGKAIRKACGSTTRRMIIGPRMPSDSAASI